MKKASKESCKIARHINDWLTEYVPSQKVCSNHTLKSYHYALSLYISFLDTEKDITPSNLRSDCFGRSYIEEWLRWLMECRKCSPETCNNRLASLRSFLKYVGNRDLSFLALSQAASQIPRRKTCRKKVNGMSKNAVQALLSAPDITTRTGRRDLVK